MSLCDTCGENIQDIVYRNGTAVQENFCLQNRPMFPRTNNCVNYTPEYQDEDSDE